MKELWAVLAGLTVFTLFYSTVIYPEIEYKGGGYVHSCTGECYEELKRNREIAKQKAVEVAAYNEANGIVVEAPDPGEKLWGGCMGCHGQNGEGGLGPKLSGQSYDYILDRLNTYKDRGTVGSQSRMMWSQASALSDKDMSDISKYISEKL